MQLIFQKVELPIKYVFAEIYENKKMQNVLVHLDIWKIYMEYAGSEISDQPASICSECLCNGQEIEIVNTFIYLEQDKTSMTQVSDRCYLFYFSHKSI